MDIQNRFGETITDYDPELAGKLEQIGYGTVDGSDRARIAQWMVMRFLKQKNLADMHPAIAALDCSLEDFAVEYRWIQRALFRLALWDLRRVAKKAGDIPGINDGLMVRWYWTHDKKCVERMVERAQREDPVGWSCRWMLRSVSESHPLLKTQLSSNGAFPWPGN